MKTLLFALAEFVPSVASQEAPEAFAKAVIDADRQIA
jgi:hypothetical protein